MRIVVRPADLSQDQDLLVKTLFQYLTPTSSHSRFDWLYRQNPHGPSLVWLALDNDNGEIVGLSAAFPRRIMVRKRERPGWVLGDFCIADKYRSLGPALQLQRATLEALQKIDREGLCYDFPSRRLVATYQRLGIAPTAQMVRLAKPLSLNGKVQKIAPARWLGNMALRLFDVAAGRKRGLDISLHSGECGEEFEGLETTSSISDGVEIQRSPAYLNWRYLKHPLIQHQILTARQNGKLKGYLVFSLPDEHAHIAEWRVSDDSRVLAALIGELVRMLRKAGTMTLNAYLLSEDPRLRYLKRMGFWPRESNPVIVYGPGCQEISSCQWLLMYGDRDS